MGSELLSELVTKPAFKVTQCREVEWRGERLVEVAFEYPHADERKPHTTWLQSGKMLLDPARYWCVRAYEGKIAAKDVVGTEKGEIPELMWAGNSIPVPRKSTWERWGRVLGRFENKQEQQWDIELDVASPQADREFTLTAFGLPEPPGFGWKRPTSWWLWVLGVGAVCLLGGGVFRWLKRRAA